MQAVATAFLPFGRRDDKKDVNLMDGWGVMAPAAMRPLKIIMQGSPHLLAMVQPKPLIWYPLILIHSNKQYQTRLGRKVGDYLGDFILPGDARGPIHVSVFKDEPWPKMPPEGLEVGGMA